MPLRDVSSLSLLNALQCERRAWRRRGYLPQAMQSRLRCTRFFPIKERRLAPRCAELRDVNDILMRVFQFLDLISRTISDFWARKRTIWKYSQLSNSVSVTINSITAGEYNARRMDISKKYAH